MHCPLSHNHLKPRAPCSDQSLQLLWRSIAPCPYPSLSNAYATGSLPASACAPAPPASELCADNMTFPGFLTGFSLPDFSISRLPLKREELCAPGSGLGKAQVENNYTALWKPESVAETWTRWPETRQRSTIKQCCCPSGLTD